MKKNRKDYVAKEKENVAKKIAKSNHEMDTNTSIIKYFPSNDDTIKILEVSSSVATSGLVEPFLFDEDNKNGVPYKVSMILLSDEEWNDINNQQLNLPEGWNLKHSQDLL